MKTTILKDYNIRFLNVKTKSIHFYIEVFFCNLSQAGLSRGCRIQVPPQIFENTVFNDF